MSILYINLAYVHSGFVKNILIFKFMIVTLVGKH